MRKRVGKIISILLICICAAIFLTGCELEKGDDPDVTKARTKICIAVAEKIFSATLADNETALAFAEKLPMTLNMNELNGNEKYFYLNENLPTNSYRPGTIREGDFMLYGSNCLVLFYDTFPTEYRYTRIGAIDDVAEFSAALDSGGVTVTFSIAEN